MPAMNIRKLLLGILALGLIARVTVMILLQTWIFPSERIYAFEEGEIAYALANGQGFSWPQTWRPVGPDGALIKPDHPVPTAWRAPVSPAILAVAFWIFGSYSIKAAMAFELFQVLLSLLSCYVLFRLGSTLFNEWTGLIAALMLALYPASIHFSVQKIEYGTLLTFMGLLIVQQTIAVSRRPSLAGNLLLGALAGVAALVNPVILAFFPFAVLWLLWTSRSDWGTSLKAAIAIGGCCAAVMAPWLIRNYLVFDRFVFIKSNFGRELVQSNFRTDGNAFIAANPETITGNDGQKSALYNQQALSLIIAKPKQLLSQMGIKFQRFWTYVSFTQGRTMLIAATAYYSVLCLGLVGVWVAWRTSQARLAMIYLLTMPIPFYLTYARLGRFRFPIEPVLILFASYAVTSVLARLYQRKRGLDGRLAAF